VISKLFVAISPNENAYLCGAMKRLRQISVLIAFFLLLCSLSASAQCAMCKAAAETSMKSDPGSMARGLNKGILYLMAVPYLLIAFIFRKQLAVVWKKLVSRAFAR
jgi:hypothetical protein